MCSSDLEGDETVGAPAPAPATTNAVDALLKGQDTSVGDGEDLTSGISGEDLDDLLSSGVLGVGGEDTGEGIEGADLTEGEAEERAGAAEINDFLASLGNMTEGEAEERKGVSDVLADLVGGEMTDREAEDRAAVRDIIDTFGYTPGTTGGGGTRGTGGTGGGTTTKSTTPTTSTPAQSGMDIMSLLALMGMMGGEQQQAAPQQQLMNLAGLRSVEDIFGQQPTSLADILRRRA